VERDLWTHTDDTLGDIDLYGFSVEARDGSVGKVDDARYDAGMSYVVVDSGPWIFGRTVMLPAGVVDRIDLENETVFVALTKDEVKHAPTFDVHAGLSDDERMRLGAYYGEPTYAGAPPVDERP
jgi:hypothetical protein